MTKYHFSTQKLALFGFMLFMLILRSASAQTTVVHFSVNHATSSDRSVYVYGSLPELGAWDVTRAVKLVGKNQPDWYLDMELPSGTTFQYRYIERSHLNENVASSSNFTAISGSDLTMTTSGTAPEARTGVFYYLSTAASPVLEILNDDGASYRSIPLSIDSDGRTTGEKLWVASLDNLPATGLWEFRVNLGGGSYDTPSYGSHYKTLLSELYLQDSEIYNYVPEASISPSSTLLIDDFIGSIDNYQVRRIWVYLPRGYNENTTKRYPVLYMHDGRRAFDTLNAPDGGSTLGADTYADLLISQGIMRECIIVAVDHADRWKEYVPEYSGQKANLTAAYYRDEIKPMIDTTYRTLTTREDTAVMGASLAGLFSAYFAWEVSDFAMNHAGLSSSFWINGLVDHMATQTPRTMRLYIDSSNADGDNYEVTLEARDALLSNSYALGENFQHYIHFGGGHNELTFRLRLERIMSFLFPITAEPGLLDEPVEPTDNPPIVSSISRADTDPTSASPVRFNVTFNEAVTGVDGSDFAITTTGALAGCAISQVTGSGTSYQVSVTHTTGDGTLRLDVVDNDTIRDSAAQPLAGAGLNNGDFTTGQVYTISRTAPRVTWIGTTSPNPTDLQEVGFMITFTESVTGVDPTDFALVLDGVTGASVTSVTGSGDRRNIYVNTGSGSGTIHLNVVDDDSIRSTAGVPLGGSGTGNGDFSGRTYTITKAAPVAPSVTSVVRASADPTNASPLSFTVSFDQSVTGVDPSDFSPTTSGSISGASISSVSGSGTSYTVSVSHSGGAGTLGLDVLDNGSIVNGDSLSLTSAFSGSEYYTIDALAPSVSSIGCLDESPCALESIHFQVNFNESVTGVDSGDFALTLGDAIANPSISSVSGSGSSYTVTVNTGSGNGTIRLDVNAGASISDALGNALSGGFTTGETYTIDKTPPSYPTANTLTVREGSMTNATTLHFDVSFSEAVTGVDSSDFDLTAGAEVIGATVSSVEGSGTDYTAIVTLTGGEGSVQLDLVDDDSIVNAGGYPLGSEGTGNGALTGPSLNVDLIAPKVTWIGHIDSTPTNAEQVGFTVIFSEAVTGVDAADFELTLIDDINDATISSVTGSGNTYTVTIATGNGDGTLQFDVVDDNTVMDAAGNYLGGATKGDGDFDGRSYDVDRVPPGVAISSNAADPTTTDRITVQVTFTESVTDFSSSDVKLTNATLENFTGSGASYSFTMVAREEGAMLANIDAGVALDGVGNSNLVAPTFYREYVDTTPSVSSIRRKNPKNNKLDKVQYDVTFSEPVTGVDASDFMVATTGSLSDVTVTEIEADDDNLYVVSIGTGAGDGTLELTAANDGMVQTPEGDMISLREVTESEIYVIDRTAPESMVTAIVGAPTPDQPYVRLEFAMADNLSEISALKIFYRKDGEGEFKHYDLMATDTYFYFNINGTEGKGVYEFYTVTIDEAGNEEAAPAEPDVMQMLSYNAVESWDMYQ